MVELRFIVPNLRAIATFLDAVPVLKKTLVNDLRKN